MNRRSLALLLAAPLLMAGCLSLNPAAVDDVDDVLGGILAGEVPEFRDPQNFPHPAYNWPTLTNPPTAVATPEWWLPIEPRALPENIQGMEHVAATQDQIKVGGGIALFGSLAFVPGYGNPSAVVDISDPANPTVLGHMEGGGTHRGAVVIPFPDGRLVVVMSTGPGLDAFDVTDPYEPIYLGTTEVRSHKVGVVPGTPIVYNAKSNGGGNLGRTPELATGTREIYDYTNPEDPVLVQNFANGYGCHHIYFWIDAAQDKYRAICAGIQMTQIWDIADPLNPEVIVNVPVHHGNPMLPSADVSIVMFSHFSILSDDGTILIVGDETGGGAAPGCDVGVNTPLGTMSGPVGNLWFYDVSDEKNPQLLSWLSPTAPAVTHPDNPINCTAHHGRLVPNDEGRDLLAMAFYGAGVLLIDFTDPMMPVIVDQWADRTQTWEVWYYNGYLFTGDLSRGLDVLTFR